LLGTLLALSLAAVAVALASVAPLWIAIPPVLMLGGFLVLLREAALTDAKREFAALESDADSPPAAGQDEHAPAGRQASVAAQAGVDETAHVPSPSPDTDEYTGATAQVIDISGRIKDQLYDQYTDAAERAIGD
jgi:hypothetical protein